MNPSSLPSIIFLLLAPACAVTIKHNTVELTGRGQSNNASISEARTPKAPEGDAKGIRSIQLLETDQSEAQQAAIGLQRVTMKYLETAADQLSIDMPLAMGVQQQAGQDIVTQLAVPIVSIVGGLVLMCVGAKFCGLFMLYFGGQAGLNIYMKLVLSQAEISKELHMKGIPAAFLVTAIQQVTAFVFLASILGVAYLTPYRYTPKPLSSWQDAAKVFIFGIAFAANIGLNNFSLSYLPISTSVMIRSSTPLATYGVSVLMSFMKGTSAGGSSTEVQFLLIGVFGALLVAAAQSGGKSEDVEGFGTMILGIFMSVLSVLACALNMVLASVLGSDLKLNPLDTIWYMSIPVAVVLMPLVFVPHPCSWPSLNPATDWQVVMKVIELNPRMMLFTIISGVLSAGYNFLMYLLVQTLSATHTTFAGNFNKAALIMLSLLIGMEKLPPGRWGALMVVGVIANVASFSMYSYVRASAKKAEAAPKLEDAKSSKGKSDQIC